MIVHTRTHLKDDFVRYLSGRHVTIPRKSDMFPMIDYQHAGFLILFAV